MWWTRHRVGVDQRLESDRIALSSGPASSDAEMGVRRKQRRCSRYSLGSRAFDAALFYG